MSDHCGKCQRLELVVHEAHAYLRRVARAAVKHPTWPSHVEKVKEAKARLVLEQAGLREHKEREHS